MMQDIWHDPAAVADILNVANNWWLLTRSEEVMGYNNNYNSRRGRPKSLKDELISKVAWEDVEQLYICSLCRPVDVCSGVLCFVQWLRLLQFRWHWISLQRVSNSHRFFHVYVSVFRRYNCNELRICLYRYVNFTAVIHASSGFVKDHTEQ